MQINGIHQLTAGLFSFSLTSVLKCNLKWKKQPHVWISQQVTAAWRTLSTLPPEKCHQSHLGIGIQRQVRVQPLLPAWYAANSGVVCLQPSTGRSLPGLNGPIGPECQRHGWLSWAHLGRAREGSLFFTWVLSPRTAHLSWVDFALEQPQGNQPTRFYWSEFWLSSKFCLQTSQTHEQYVFTASIYALKSTGYRGIFI